MRRLIYIVLLFQSVILTAQIEEQDSLQMQYYFFDGDSIPRNMIELEPVIVFQQLKFASYKDKVRYYILKRKTLKVYPYAKLAADRLVELTARLEQIKTKSKKRQYTKIIQHYIEDEFSTELKNLTRTEGQILVKLIHRQTGITAFDLVKELRSGWRAFWYNTTAKMFDIDIKLEYQPQTVHEDYLIEDILQRAFANGTLEEQKSVLDFDYLELTNKWKTANNNVSFQSK